MRTQLACLTAFALASSAALAQTAETAPATSTRGIADYWWLIIVLIVIAVAIWYFMRGRNRV
jgi:hypothetical protein